MYSRLRKLIIENKKEVFLLIVFVVYAVFSFGLINRPFGKVHNLKLAIDDKIPFIKELIIVYHTFMPLVLIVGFIIIDKDKNLFRRYIFNMFLAQSLAYIIFYYYQTYVPRFDMNLLGEDIFSHLIRLTYKLDNAYCGAPSLHVCNMTLTSIYFSKLPYKKFTKFIVIAYMTLVAITTVLVKQHVFLDIPTGFVYALLVYLLSTFIYGKINKKEMLQ